VAKLFFRTPDAKAFTIIELLVVVAVLGLLASIAIPAYEEYAKRSKLAEAVLNLGNLTSLETQFFLRPRIAGNGSTLEPCYLLASRSPAFPTPQKQNFVSNTSFDTLGFNIAGPTYFAFEVYGSGAANRGACTSTTHVTIAPAANTFYAFATAFADLDGDRLWNMVGFLLGSPAAFAAVGPIIPTPGAAPGGHTIGTTLERSLGTNPTNGLIPLATPVLTVKHN